MKQYCYVIINNAGQSWPALGGPDTNPPRDPNVPILPQLLEEGWGPIRETPMGGGTSALAHSLVLLEKAVKPAKTGRASKSS